MKIRSIPAYLVLVVLATAYYAVVGICLQHKGYFHPEALFLAEKASLVYGHQGNLLNILGLTYPSIPFYSILFFTMFSPLWAPLLGTSLAMSLWVCDLLRTLNKSGAGPWTMVCCSLLFFIHPGFLFLAASGTTGAYILLFFYLMIKHIFLYFKFNTTYYLSMVGIFFVFLVFTDYRYLWFCLFLTPLLLFISLNSLNLKSGETLQQLQIVFNNASLRRKILRRTYAIFVIIFLLPVAGFLFFLFLNRLHIGQIWFFEQSPYTMFNRLIFRTGPGHAAHWLDLFQSGIFIVLLTNFILSPLLFVVLVRINIRMSHILIVLSVLVLVEFFAIKYGYSEIVFTDYALLIITAFLAWFNMEVSGFRGGWRKLLLPACALLGLVTGTLYFFSSPQADEANFASALKTTIGNKQEGGAFSEEKAVVDYLKSSTSPADLVLTDDAVTFPVVALYGRTRRFLLPDESIFGAALENPPDYTAYILVSNPENSSGAYDVVDVRYPWLFLTGWDKQQPVFATLKYRLYRVNL